MKPNTARVTIGSLKDVDVAFMDQTNIDDKPIGMIPAVLLIPTALTSRNPTLATACKGEQSRCRSANVAMSSSVMNCV